MPTMTIVEASVATGRIEMEGGPQRATPVPINISEYTRCATYGEAKSLAACRRREGMPAQAVLVMSLDCWCVRESTAPQRYR